MIRGGILSFWKRLTIGVACLVVVALTAWIGKEGAWFLVDRVVHERHLPQLTERVYRLAQQAILHTRRVHDLDVELHLAKEFFGKDLLGLLDQVMEKTQPQRESKGVGSYPTCLMEGFLFLGPGWSGYYDVLEDEFEYYQDGYLGLVQVDTHPLRYVGVYWVLEQGHFKIEDIFYEWDVKKRRPRYRLSQILVGCLLELKGH